MFFIIPPLIISVVIFFVIPQIEKFRTTLGIHRAIKMVPWDMAIRLRLFGLKTPIVSTLSMMWSFLIVESNDLSGFSWDHLIPGRYAVWVSFIFWVFSLWTHFSGLNAAASSPPVTDIPAKDDHNGY